MPSVSCKKATSVGCSTAFAQRQPLWGTVASRSEMQGQEQRGLAVEIHSIGSLAWARGQLQPAKPSHCGNFMCLQLLVAGRPQPWGCTRCLKLGFGFEQVGSPVF